MSLGTDTDDLAHETFEEEEDMYCIIVCKLEREVIYVMETLCPCFSMLVVGQ